MALHCYITRLFLQILVTMPPSLLCHFPSVPKGGIVSKFDCSPKIKFCLRKKAKFSSAGGSAPQTPVPQAAGGFAPTIAPLANFWLHACLHLTLAKNILQFRRRSYIIFTKVLSHAKCVWSRLQKRPPMQNFYNLSIEYNFF